MEVSWASIWATWHQISVSDESVPMGALFFYQKGGDVIWLYTHRSIG